MKRTIQLLTLVFALSLTIGSSYAQKTLKIGHFKSAELIQKMPEYDSAQTKLQAYSVQIQGELESMVKEVERMQAEYESKADQLSDLLKQNKQKEIQDAYNRCQTFRQNSTVEIQAKQEELINQIFEKVRKAAQEVAKANKFDYILEENSVLWYATDSDDVTSLIEKQLGLKK